MAVSQNTDSTTPHECGLWLDLDGLLLRTEGPQRPVCQQLTLELFGLETTWADFSFALGASRDETARGFNERFAHLPLREGVDLGSAPSVGDFMLDRLVEIRHQQIERDGVELMPGAERLLDLSDRGRLRRAVATSRQERRARELLGHAGVGHRVEIVVGSDSDGVKAPKPAPDIGLEASRRLEVPPKLCWALEDSPPGVEGQARAGAKVLYVFDRTVAEPSRAARALATHTVGSLDEAVDFLQKELGV
ncbi:MAG: HAD family hydrolase [Deltaproteobacteria bacterium]|nr:HAD family hydrolase [Deltaproteobacteria bacterium]